MLFDAEGNLSWSNGRKLLLCWWQTQSSEKACQVENLDDSDIDCSYLLNQLTCEDVTQP